ncbi:hypothetical protein ACHAWX_001587 [Stephanocyclus meneghinianus]
MAWTDSDMKSTPRQMMDETLACLHMSTASSPILSESAMATMGVSGIPGTPCGSRKAAWASAKEPCGVRWPLGPISSEGNAEICWAGGANGTDKVDIR